MTEVNEELGSRLILYNSFLDKRMISDDAQVFHLVAPDEETARQQSLVGSKILRDEGIVILLKPQSAKEIKVIIKREKTLKFDLLMK